MGDTLASTLTFGYLKTKAVPSQLSCRENVENAVKAAELIGISCANERSNHLQFLQTSVDASGPALLKYCTQLESQTHVLQVVSMNLVEGKRTLDIITQEASPRIQAMRASIQSAHARLLLRQHKNATPSSAWYSALPSLPNKMPSLANPLPPALTRALPSFTNPLPSFSDFTEYSSRTLTAGMPTLSGSMGGVLSGASELLAWRSARAGAPGSASGHHASASSSLHGTSTMGIARSNADEAGGAAAGVFAADEGSAHPRSHSAPGAALAPELPEVLAGSCAEGVPAGEPLQERASCSATRSADAAERSAGEDPQVAAYGLIGTDAIGGDFSHPLDPLAACPPPVP